MTPPVDELEVTDPMFSREIARSTIDHWSDENTQVDQERERELEELILRNLKYDSEFRESEESRSPWHPGRILPKSPASKIQAALSKYAEAIALKRYHEVSVKPGSSAGTPEGRMLDANLITELKSQILRETIEEATLTEHQLLTLLSQDAVRKLRQEAKEGHQLVLGRSVAALVQSSADKYWQAIARIDQGEKWVDYPWLVQPRVVAVKKRVEGGEGEQAQR